MRVQCGACKGIGPNAQPTKYAGRQWLPCGCGVTYILDDDGIWRGGGFILVILPEKVECEDCNRPPVRGSKYCQKHQP